MSYTDRHKSQRPFDVMAETLREYGEWRDFDEHETRGGQFGVEENPSRETRKAIWRRKKTMREYKEATMHRAEEEPWQPPLVPSEFSTFGEW